MLKIQRLADARELPASTVLGKVGRVWINVAAPKRRRATAERCAINARVDNPDALIRVTR